MNEWEWNALEDRLPLASIEVGGVALKPGDRVQLRPRAGGDVFDLALAGQTATIEAIEQDYEDHYQVAVVLDDDPGKDLGLARQPGHRFFFEPGELEPLGPTPPVEAPVILLAGIGNIFCGDDGFGVEVAQRLLRRGPPAGIHVADFGVRGFDLACALESPDLTILVDAYPHGQAPGTLTLIEPTLDGAEPDAVEAHGLDPVSVLRLARSLHAGPRRVLLLGCEPESLGGEEGAMGLSAPVAAAVDRAVALIDALVADVVGGHLSLKEKPWTQTLRFHS